MTSVLTMGYTDPSEAIAMTPPSAALATSSRATKEPIKVIKMSKRQWRKAANARLNELGLTYDELERQAEQRNFVSTAARKLWYLIGGTL